MDCQSANPIARPRTGQSRRRRSSARRYAPQFGWWSRVRALLAVTLATGILLTLLLAWGKPRELASAEAIILPAAASGNLPGADSVTTAVHAFQQELNSPAGLRQLFRDARQQLGPTPSGLPLLLAQADPSVDNAALAERIRCALISSAADAPHTVRLIVRDEDPTLAAMLVQELAGLLTARLNAVAEANLVQRELLRAELCEPALAQRTPDELAPQRETPSGRVAPEQDAPLLPQAAPAVGEPAVTPPADLDGAGPHLQGPLLGSPTSDSQPELPQPSEPRRLEVSGARVDEDPLVFERRVAMEELGELLTTRRQLIERLTPQHPAVKEVDARTAELQSLLARLPQPNWDLQMASSVSEVPPAQEPTKSSQPRPLHTTARILNEVTASGAASIEEASSVMTAYTYRVHTLPAESATRSGVGWPAWPWGVGLLIGGVVAVSLGRLARTPVLPGPVPIMKIPQVVVPKLELDSDAEITVAANTWKLCRRARLARRAWLVSELLLALLLITGCLLVLARPAMLRGWLTDPLATWTVFEGVILRLLGSSY